MALPGVSFPSTANDGVDPVASSSLAALGDVRRASTNAVASTTVRISFQGQQLNQQAQTNPAAATSNQVNQSQSVASNAPTNTNTATGPNTVPQSGTSNAAPGISLIQGDRKGGQINTYA